MSLYSKTRKHIDMNRVKELRENKLEEQKIAEVKEQQEEILAELKKIEIKEDPKYSNWRREINEDLIEINEDMTTASMGMINYPANGDVDIVDNETALIGFSGQNDSVSGGTVTLTDDGDNDIADGTHTAFRQAMYTVDATKSAHLKITVAKGGGTSSWTDRGESWDDDVSIVVGDNDDMNAPLFVNRNLSSGTHIIKLPGNYKNTYVLVQQFAKLASDGSPGTTSPLRIYNVSLQRRTPLNVFVSLDDPEANAFIRGGLGGDKERRQRLKEQLDAGNELMIRMGLEPSKTSPGDIELAQGLPYTDEDDAFDDPYYKGPPPDLDDDSDFDLDSFEYARIYPPDADPGDIQWPRKKNQKVPPGPGARPSGIPIGPELPRARKKPTTMVAHHEPEGEVIKEKKSFKDITKKIPGYYDGKPSPLGFPVEEPPKMKNGFHPDLVDGKKVANRFNRLDPQSAKAMPKTGNPHIDKKVRAAAKKPK